MSRIINVDGTPTTQRNRLRRAIAEILRHLSAKQEVDAETKDMLAFVVVALHAMEDSIDASCVAWEKRNYYLKADRFRYKWEWLGPTAARIEDLIMTSNWSLLPTELSVQAARFHDVKVSKFTKSPSLWNGTFDKLRNQTNGHR